MRIFLDALSRKPTVSVGTIAYIISNMEIIRRRFPNCEFIMLSVDPEVDKLYVAGTPFKITFIKRSNNEIGTFFQIRRILREVDIVVSSWGDAYVSLPPYLLFLKVMFLKSKRVPLILFPSSIGPFNGGIKDYITYLGLKRFNVLTIRDQITYDYLKKFPLKRLKLVHDTAFVLQPEKEPIIDNILQELGLNEEKFIGLNISILLLHQYITIDKYYAKLMANYITWIRDSFEVPILLIPHQIFPDKYNYSKNEYISKGGDDRYAIEQVIGELTSGEGVYHLEDHYSPTVLKGIIAKSEIFIGGRMHSIIASLSSRVPSIILGYSHKAEGMMKMLEMGKFVFSISDDESFLRSMTSKLWTDKERIRKRLEKIIPEISEDIYSLTDILTEFYAVK